MLRMDLHDANRLAWNEATIAHNSHKQDQAGFLAQGGSTLFPEEIELLGDLAGQTLVHLQCNAGQDTLSLAHLGAIVTGVDISNAAIDFARRLSEDSGIPATFVRTDLYDWFAETAAGSQRFDVAFCSYGTLCSRISRAGPRVSPVCSDRGAGLSWWSSTRSAWFLSPTGATSTPISPMAPC
jgi:hypothetical protein